MIDASQHQEEFPPDSLTTLRHGHSVSDEKFDRIFSGNSRSLSSRHWTPMNVALWAAKLLGTGPDVRVLDVGCGPGKFCFIGEATTSASYFGIEQRLHFVEEAERIRLAHNISRANFIHGNMIDLDWRDFHAFYLFNPFLENVTGLARIDQTVALSLEHYNTYVDCVVEKLRAMPLGTRVVTYHGFGGAMPEGYILRQKKAIGTAYLDLWVKEDSVLHEPLQKILDRFE